MQIYFHQVSYNRLRNSSVQEEISRDSQFLLFFTLVYSLRGKKSGQCLGNCFQSYIYREFSKRGFHYKNPSVFYMTQSSLTCGAKLIICGNFPFWFTGLPDAQRLQVQNLHFSYVGCSSLRKQFTFQKQMVVLKVIKF